MSASFTLSKPMQQFVAERATVHGLKNGNAYVNHLLKEEQKRLAKEYLLEKLQEGRASGLVDVTDELWEESKKRALQHFKAKKRAPMK